MLHFEPVLDSWCNPRVTVLQSSWIRVAAFNAELYNSPLLIFVDPAPRYSIWPFLDSLDFLLTT